MVRIIVEYVRSKPHKIYGSVGWLAKVTSTSKTDFNNKASSVFLDIPHRSAAEVIISKAMGQNWFGVYEVNIEMGRKDFKNYKKMVKERFNMFSSIKEEVAIKAVSELAYPKGESHE